MHFECIALTARPTCPFKNNILYVCIYIDIIDTEVLIIQSHLLRGSFIVFWEDQWATEQVD